jgi:hypothetical protein
MKEFCDNEKLFFLFFQFNDWVLAGFQTKAFVVFFFLYVQRASFQQDDKICLLWDASI